MNIDELLKLRGIDVSKRIKLVRHQDGRFDFEELRRKNCFELYQSFQSKPVFKDCDYVVSFIGTTGTQAALYGVFKVDGVESAAGIALPPGCPPGIRTP